MKGSVTALMLAVACAGANAAPAVSDVGDPPGQTYWWCVSLEAI